LVEEVRGRFLVGSFTLQQVGEGSSAIPGFDSILLCLSVNIFDVDIVNTKFTISQTNQMLDENVLLEHCGNVKKFLS
jgi:hypothetical protein